MNNPTVLSNTLASSTTTSATSPSISPAANSLVVAIVGLGSGANVTFTTPTIGGTLGTTLTWSISALFETHGGSGSAGVFLATAPAGASPGSGTIIGGWTGSATRRLITVLQQDSQHAVTPVPQTVRGASGTNPVPTLDSTPAATSNVIAAIAALNRATDVVAGSGFTELDEQVQSTGPLLALQTMYDNASADATANWTGITGALNVGAIIEIAAASVTPDYLQVDDQPTNTQEDVVISPAIVVSKRLESDDSIDTSFTGNITVAIGTNPASGTLSGTLTVAAVAGEATFNDLHINNPGAGYSLTFTTSGGITEAESDFFDITAQLATKFLFHVEPTDEEVAGIISPAVVVRAVNDANVLDTSWVGDVEIALSSNPASATLNGTTTKPAVGGVATFDDLSLSAAGDGVTLIAREA